MRDFEANPYSPDERRIVDWIIKRMNGDVGGGDDPIGYVLSALEYALYELNEKQP